MRQKILTLYYLVASFLIVIALYNDLHLQVITSGAGASQYVFNQQKPTDSQRTEKVNTNELMKWVQDIDPNNIKQ